MIFDPNDPEQAAILATRERNAQRLAAFAQQGMPLTVGGRTEGILELLLDAVLGTSPERLAFEREQAENIAGLLDQAEAQVRQQKLTAGVVGLGPAEVAQLAAARNGGPRR